MSVRLSLRRLTVLGVAAAVVAGGCGPTDSSRRADTPPSAGHSDAGPRPSPLRAIHRARTPPAAGWREEGPQGSPPWQEAPRATAARTISPAWQRQVEALRAIVTEHPAAPVIFIGDSITMYWQSFGVATWDRRYAPMGALDLGIGGDTTQNVLWRLDHDQELAGLHPATVVLLIGTNDYHHGWDPDQVAEGVTAVTAAILRVLRAAHVIVLSILPRGGPRSVARADVDATNAVLAATTFPAGVTYVDIDSYFLDAAGRQRPGLFNADQLHPTAAGYVVFAAALDHVKL